jgi:hypothetical protein
VRLGRGGWLPNCGYCGEPLKEWKHEHGVDMHEAFLTRGDIQGRPDLAPLIMVRENCALVHHGECHRGAATKEGQRRVARHIIYWADASSIMSWLTRLEDDFVGTTITEAKNLVTEVTNE